VWQVTRSFQTFPLSDRVSWIVPSPRQVRHLKQLLQLGLYPGTSSSLQDLHDADGLIADAEHLDEIVRGVDRMAPLG
jgi:hypothetical protein